MTGWFVSSWGNPISYDYGGNVYYEGDTVYMDGQPAATSQEYAEQAYQIADNIPEEVNEEQVEWMPLGVYAITNEEAGDPNMFLQLAVSKEGYIAGTYYNQSTDTTKPVEGTVDKDTQRAAWTIAGAPDGAPVMETGVYNLTQEQTAVLVHFGPEQTQQWFLVRLEEPEGSEGAQSQ